jgi:hypothetical protein
MSRVIITQHFNGELYAYNSKNGAVFVIDLSKRGGRDEERRGLKMENGKWMKDEG